MRTISLKENADMDMNPSKTEHMKCEKYLYRANMRTVSLKENWGINPIIYIDI